MKKKQINDFRRYTICVLFLLLNTVVNQAMNDSGDLKQANSILNRLCEAIGLSEQDRPKLMVSEYVKIAEYNRENGGIIMIHGSIFKLFENSRNYQKLVFSCC